MKKVILAVAISTLLLLALSAGMLFGSIYLFPHLSEQYLSPVFRSAGHMDWMYYVHPLILSVALKWFWARYKGMFTGNFVVRALEVALVYVIVAMVPVLWLTFSAIDVSAEMILTWTLYGFIQAFAAGIVFARLNP